MVVLWGLIEKVFKFVFKKGYFNESPCLHKAFYGHSWKGMTSFLSGNINFTSFTKDCYLITNSVDPDEIWTLYLGIHCLQKSIYRSH